MKLRAVPPPRRIEDPVVGPSIVAAAAAGQASSRVRAVPDCLHLGSAAILMSSWRRSGMGFVELRGDRANVGVSERMQDDAFLVAVQLRDCPDFDLYADTRCHPHHGFRAGSVAIYDLRTNLLFDLRSSEETRKESFHAIDFYLPRKALDALADECGAPRIDELRHRPGAPMKDDVARDLLRSIQPTLSATPEERNGLFVDHVAMALATHVAHAYGGLRPRTEAAVSRLAPSQLRRAQELLEANLEGRISLEDLAQACGLSRRHFTRAFRGSTGHSPHAWLLRRRIEKAKALLIDTPRVLTEVALDSGFADQSHLTRTFQRLVGVSPGAWRRLHRR